MKQKPLVSIIIPTHNRASFISRAITAALEQSYSNIEVIVVDDCSSDNTKDVVLGFSNTKVIYFRNKQNKGGPYSRNRGLSHAKGDYIMFLDDDDSLHPDKITLQVEKFESSKVKNLGVVTCDVSYKRSDIASVRKNRLQGIIYKQLLRSYCVFGTETMLIKKTCFDVIKGFDIKLASNQEYDLAIRLAQHFSFDYVPRVLTYKYESTDQISFNFTKKLNGTRYLYKKHLSAFKEQGVYGYNFFRFRYLFFKYSVGKYCGRRVYLWLP
ncbi:MAG: glycosyltransferase family 2 protein [Candidatus Woesearchaeota archaeon]